MPSEHCIGPHRYVIDGDLIHNMADPRAAMDLEMMQAYTKLVESVLKKYGRIFMLSDGRAIFKVSPDARRHLANWPEGRQIAASAIYGANAATRAIVVLISAAMQRIQKHRNTPPINFSFFASEAEARAWIEKERRQYLLTHPDAPQ